MLDQLSRREKIVIFCIGTLESLKAKGFVEGGRFCLNEVSQPIYEQLKLSGFRPTSEEYDECLRFLCRKSPN